jgi:3-hydroxyacyl-CoA dehydrogenase
MNAAIRPDAAVAAELPIQKAAVIGAGSMGSGIAAHLANAGIPVVLLDLPSEGGARNAIAEAGIQRQLKAGGFMHASAARLVTPGNTEEGFSLLADADWIVEAVLEDTAVKRALYKRVEAARKDGSLVSSNTSTILLSRLTEGMGERFARDFSITHFFNPPRTMQLAELIGGPRTDAAALEKLRTILDLILGKAVVAARDTPGFIANRIGCYWMAAGVHAALSLGLTVEEADAVLSGAFGWPRTGLFGLFDLIGVDLVPPIWGSLEEALPADDGMQAEKLARHPLIVAMLERGLRGRKAGAGFYRLAADRSREALDLKTLQYRPMQPASDLPTADLRQLCTGDTPQARFAWHVLSRGVGYSAAVAPDIAEDVKAVDDAMSLGYNWRTGPFALADRAGAGWIAERLAAEGVPVPPLLARAAELGGFHSAGGNEVLSTDGACRAVAVRPGSLRLTQLRGRSQPVFSTAGASLFDMEEGVACLELKTKMNVFDETVFTAVLRAADELPRGFRALVIGSEAPRAFSAGADIRVFLERIGRGDRAGFAAFVEEGQHAFQTLKYAPFPVVSAAFGIAVGGGCEVLLHSDAIVAHAELTAGLVETKIGIVPAWGGCAQMLQRGAEAGLDSAGAAAAAFDAIFAGRISTSALDARATRILRDADAITMNRARLLADARARAVALAAGYRPPARPAIQVCGEPGKAALLGRLEEQRRDHRVTAADETIAAALATVLTGGVDAATSLGEAAIMRLEKEALLDLAFLEATRARMEHMLQTGKPLRN